MSTRSERPRKGQKHRGRDGARFVVVRADEVGRRKRWWLPDGMMPATIDSLHRGPRWSGVTHAVVLDR